MTKLINSTGDRLLGLFVKRVDAGACVPEHGDSCRVTRYRCYYQQRQRRYGYGRVSCTGPCTVSTWGAWVVVGSC